MIRKGRRGNPAAAVQWHGGVKITAEQAVAIIRDERQNVVIAREYGVTPSHIGSIKKGRKWKTLRRSGIPSARSIATHRARTGEAPKPLPQAVVPAVERIFHDQLNTQERQRFHEQ